MCFEVRGVNHERIRWAVFSRQVTEYSVKNAHLAPAFETVIQGLVRAVFLRGGSATQTVFNNENNPRNNLAIIHPRDAVSQREKWFNPHQLLPEQPKQITHQRL